MNYSKTKFQEAIEKRLEKLELEKKSQEGEDIEIIYRKRLRRPNKQEVLICMLFGLGIGLLCGLFMLVFIYT